MAVTPCEDTSSYPNSPVQNFKDEFDIFHVVFLDEIPQNDKERTIKLASWSSAVLYALTEDATKDFPTGKKAKFIECAVRELLNEIFALKERKEKEKSEWLRSVSKMIVPLKRALDKCTTEDSKAKVQKAIDDAEAAENKDRAKRLSILSRTMVLSNSFLRRNLTGYNILKMNPYSLPEGTGFFTMLPSGCHG